MCGIVGCIGKNHGREYIINGLKTLDYRGYDSAGVAFLKQNQIDIYKDAGSVEHLNSLIPSSIDGDVLIGHTRWATHGRPNKTNSHPHLSFDGEFVLVHNGIVERFAEHKANLISEGATFSSDTDSEVIVNMIALFYKEEKDVLKAIKRVMDTIEGSYAISLIHKGENRLYVLKNVSPLLIGIGDDFNLVASDASPMIEHTNKFIELGDKEFGYVEKSSYKIFNLKGEEVQKELISKDISLVKHDLNGYEHYMLKEIEEIPSVLTRLINHYVMDQEFNFDKQLIEKVRQSDHIIFLGCGTSYHASLVGGRYFEEMLGIPTASYIASEWAFHPMFPGKKPFIIFISQSGETADLIHCLNIVKEHHYDTMLVTNTSGSTLERGCDYSLNIQAGVEVSVASTKAYSAQVAMLLLLVAAVKEDKKIPQEIINALPIIQTIKLKKDDIRRVAKMIKDKQSIFYIGRGYDYYLSLEASLKLKEISYIHSEAIAGGELKHGPIALIENGTPVIVFITDNITANSMRGNIEEVKSRGARVFVISTKELAKEGDTIVVDGYPNYLSSIIVSSVAFYLAYYTSLSKGYDVDKPRNLAKSVTVE
ncbi:MAG: glutamine--fructose-6-phosphate transaminase (isomerizing) [Bacilli bacterium]|nr:glutamine--fructose-6-phosphate transaminase (isomerizing) [Bacilli bacterium]